MTPSNSPTNPDEDNHIRLQRGQSGWRINFGVQARQAGIEGGDYVVVDIEDPEYDPLVVVGQLPEQPENPEKDPFTRKVMNPGDTLAVKIPRRHLDDRGLDLPLDTYDNDNPLLFEPLVDAGLVGLAPLGYHDGTEYVPPGHRDENPEVESAPDPEQSEQATLVETTGPDAVGPIPPEAISAAAQVTGVGTEQVRDALVTLADQLDADTLNARHVPEFDPVETPEGVVYVVDSDAWDSLADDVALDAGVQQAVRQAHVRAAEGLLDSYAPNSDARRFAAEYDAIVLPSE